MARGDGHRRVAHALNAFSIDVWTTHEEGRSCALITDSDAHVIMVDRRHAPGGHWNDAYPFVRLHQPSSYYGVNSLPLGNDTIDRDGPNRGLYEQASAPEICAYYDCVMRKHLLASPGAHYFE